MADTPSPTSQAYRMPAEWEPHDATWLVWPHQTADWPGKFKPIAWVYAEIIRKLAEGERIVLLVESEDRIASVRRILKDAGAAPGQIDFFPCPTDRGWTRDTGPMFVRNPEGQLAIVDWAFNGWAKYENHRLDDQVAAAAARRLGAKQFQPVWNGRTVVLEGGSIDVNGAGCLLTTEECLLSPIQSRNPGMPREAIEQVLCAHLGVRKILWLRNGIAGDDTHGHVDDLARFTAPDTIVVAQEADPSDTNYAALRENLGLLQEMTDAEGRPFRVVPLPMPRPLFFRGIRLPASYANFYIGNRYVLVPTFNDPNDRVALSTLAGLFPDREVAGIHSVDLVWGLGTIHCMTQQQPAGRF